MKKFLFLICMLFSVSAFAQVPVEENRINELSKMGKLNLTEIYIALVHDINRALPNYPLVSAQENVPESRHIGRKWRRINKSTYFHNKVIDENYRYILPYADKRDLVNAIVYLEQINKLINR
jgi:hypothetical protein